MIGPRDTTGGATGGHGSDVDTRPGHQARLVNDMNQAWPPCWPPASSGPAGFPAWRNAGFVAGLDDVRSRPDGEARQ
jgi:hypothetical protein